jgi:DNA mismatch repair protein MutL
MTPDEHNTHMPKRIQRLAPGVADKIAAGEVVERPSAVVKELVENAIDAGAARIVVEIEHGGKKYIRVTDDGCGLNPEDVPLAFERHATSKVTEIMDLVRLSTLGFRGEALSSIAAVSYLDMTTRRSGDSEGIHIALAGGRETVRKASSASQGTTVIVKDLFFNTPARLKFMKSATTEAAYISDLMSKLALSHPERSFQFVLDKRLVFKTPGDNKTFSAIYATLERALAKSMFEFQFGNDLIRVHGWASKIEYNRGNRNYQMTFVNGRYVKSRTTLDAIQYAYQGLLPSGRFPAVILYLEISPDAYDVNIHPQKTEIKFEREDAIKNFLSVELKRALESLQQVPVKTFVAAPVGISPNSAGNRLVMGYEGAVQEALNGDTHGHTAAERPKTLMEMPYNGINIGQNKNFNQEVPQTTSSETSDGTASKPGRQNVYTSTPMTFDTSLLEKLRLPEADSNAALAPEATPTAPKETLYDNARYVGQVFKSFLLYEKDDHMLWIDQHAAHEKVLYESFKNAYEKREVVRQILVEPILIECDTMTALRLSERTEALEHIGFTLESFGETDFILREVPMLFDIPGTRRFFETLKDHLGDLRQAAQKPIEDRLMSMACKAAVKSNDPLTPFEAAQLIKSLRGLDSPYTCPHGRPLVVKVERSEIEKKFLRT